MSAIANFIRIPTAAIEQLGSDYGQTLQRHGESVAEYGWSGYVLATLLAYLDEKEIPLTKSSYDSLATELSRSRGETIFIFTSAHRDAYLPRLSPGQFSANELGKYFNEFNGTRETEIGQAMLDGIASLRDGLAALDADSVIVFSIG